jgi:MurNAc alpha-1-phosphate uridylyltransferase
MQAANALAWLVLVPNPPHHPQGDFRLAGGRVCDADGSAGALTFSGIGLYQPSLFAGIVRGNAARLAPLLRALLPSGAVLGERFDGPWADIGTPERLDALDRQLRLHNAD